MKIQRWQQNLFSIPDLVMHMLPCFFGGGLVFSFSTPIFGKTAFDVSDQFMPCSPVRSHAVRIELSVIDSNGNSKLLEIVRRWGGGGGHKNPLTSERVTRGWYYL